MVVESFYGLLLVKIKIKSINYFILFDILYKCIGIFVWNNALKNISQVKILSIFICWEFVQYCELHFNIIAIQLIEIIKHTLLHCCNGNFKSIFPSQNYNIYNFISILRIIIVRKILWFRFINTNVWKSLKNNYNLTFCNKLFGVLINRT